MTRKEIENIPKNINTLLDSSVTMHTRQKLDEKLNKVCELAIKALEQQSCEDCISRVAVRQALDRYIQKAQSNGTKDDLISFEELVIKSLPSVHPKPKTGHWERHYSRPNVYADLFWHCSECGYKNSTDHANMYYHHCPNCGAKMEG